MKKGILTICAALAICSAGSASAQSANQEVRRIIAEYDRKNEESRARFEAALHSGACKGRIHIGMSDAAVKLAICTPDNINSHVTLTHTDEQWVYYGGAQYLYFEDGRLVGIQRRTP